MDDRMYDQQEHYTAEELAVSKRVVTSLVAILASAAARDA
jgi:CxxC motif-containing protein